MLFLMLVGKIIGHNFCARPRFLACCVFTRTTREDVRGVQSSKPDWQNKDVPLKLKRQQA